MRRHAGDWARAGAHVELAVLTDGSKGTWDPAADIAELVATRQQEQRAAAETLGAHAVHFFGVVDGELEADVATRRRVCELIRTVASRCRPRARPVEAVPPAPGSPARRRARDRRHRRRPRSALLSRRGFTAPAGSAPPVRGTGGRPRRTCRRRGGRPQGRRAPVPPQPVALDHGHRRAGAPRPRHSAPRSRARVRDDIDAAGGEAFKLLDDL